MTKTLDRASLAWGGAPPDWIAALAGACDASTQASVAKRLGYSGAVVSLMLNNRYGGDLGAVEQAVRGALMAATVDCPVVGELASHTCLGHQKAQWAPHNPQRISFFRACRGGCPNFRNGGQS